MNQFNPLYIPFVIVQHYLEMAVFIKTYLVLNKFASKSLCVIINYIKTGKNRH